MTPTPPPAPGPPGWGRAEVVDAFDDAGRWFVSVVGRVGAEQWERPGLGVWTVRELAGHTGRAFATAEEYLTDAGPVGTDGHPGGSSGIDGEDAVAGAAAYFLAVRDNPRLHDDVAERGRRAGAALGTAPGSSAAGELEALASRVIALVRAAPATAAFKSCFGLLPFSAYLASRVVELVVHTVDLEDACGLELDVPDRAGSLAVAVVGELAVRRGSADEVLAALGGRRALPEGFGVFSGDGGAR